MRRCFSDTYEKPDILFKKYSVSQNCKNHRENVQTLSGKKAYKLHSNILGEGTCTFAVVNYVCFSNVKILHRDYESKRFDKSSETPQVIKNNSKIIMTLYYSTDKQFINTYIHKNRFVTKEKKCAEVSIVEKKIGKKRKERFLSMQKFIFLKKRLRV